jgi:uncharacterized protein (TIGR02147 family)
VSNPAAASIQDFVRFRLSQNSAGERSTLKAVTAQLGLKSPSLLSMIAHGKRLPSERLLRQLLELWKISAKDRKILLLQLQVEKKHQKGKDALALRQEISRLNPPSAFYKLKLNEIESIRDWYVLAVRAMANAPDFVAEPQWISQRLRSKITPTQAKAALRLLLDRGLLRQDPETGAVTVAQEMIETSHDVPSESIRQHHRGMMNRALEALSEQSIDERLFNAVTLNFETKDLAAAKHRILNFAKAFHDEFGQNLADSVYQLNIQFFGHTSPKGRKK